IRRHVIRDARKLLRSVQRKRESYADRRKIFLRKSFEDQMTTLQDRLKKYQSENIEGKNSALINQTYAQIEEMEQRSKQRLQEIERQRSIQLQPVKRIAQFRAMPGGNETGRIIPDEYKEFIEDYELSEGRLNVRAQAAFGLVDFISEDLEGELRFIIM